MRADHVETPSSRMASLAAIARWILVCGMPVCVTLGPASTSADVPGAAADWGRFYPSISLTSDYRYNGVSYSDGPTMQASLHWIGPRKYYAGIWTSGVDFDDPGNTSFELDFYLGRDFDLGSGVLSVEALYTSFPDKSFRGPTYDFYQLKTRLRRPIGPLTIGAQAAWTPAASYGSGEALRIGIESAYAVRKWLSASVNVGRRWIQFGVDRTYWDAGATVSWRRLSLDIRYVDTNLSVADCGDADRCDSTVVGTATYRFW